MILFRLLSAPRALRPVCARCGAVRDQFRVDYPTHRARLCADCALVALRQEAALGHDAPDVLPLALEKR